METWRDVGCGGAGGAGAGAFTATVFGGEATLDSAVGGVLTTVSLGASFRTAAGTAGVFAGGAFFAFATGAVRDTSAGGGVSCAGLAGSVASGAG